MGMTMTQKILAAHAGEASVKAGQLIQAKLDIVMGNDITTAVALKEFQKTGAKEVFDKDKVVIVLDHFTPNKDIKAAEQCKACRTFAYDMEVKNFFDVGQMGIEHALLPEKGIVVPGQVIIGADSHTCTYGALGAFSTGIGSTDMAMDDRFSMANMAIEAGAKNGIFPVDEKTMEYVKKHSTKEPVVYEADPDAEYDEVYTIDLSKLRPTVAFPHLPENTKTIDEAGEIAIDQVVIGSCTNGRLNDMKIAAEILRGKQVHPKVRTIVIPATQQIYLDCIRLGYVEDIVKAGAIFSTPTCGPCLGGHMGILAAGERCVSTTNRNFVGRMGHTESEVYLASPAVAAASAISGYIADPEKIAGGME